MSRSRGLAGFLALAALLLLWGCDDTGVAPAPGSPAPPRDLDAYYYAGAVHLSWSLDAQWRDESFRVYGKRLTDPDPFLLAEVTSCFEGNCRYTDVNIVAQTTYEYYVAAVDPATGRETPSDYWVEVEVPSMTPPPPPEGVVAVALDGAVYLRWDPESLEVTGARFFRVYLEGDEGDVFLLGDTDSPGFLDLRVENGFTFRYFVTSVDAYGHEGEGSVLASATPRPDFHDEVLYAFEDRPEDAGFRFQPSEVDDPIRHGDAPDRHFRVEADEAGWWLVPGPDVAVYPDAFFTTALRCGPAADASCSELSQAPASGYAAQDLELVPGFTYVLRLPDEGGGFRYAALRVSHVGYAQDGRIVIFDWAHQLQPDNRQLAPAGP